MGQAIPSKEVYHGRNASVEQDKFVRCSRCGFPCKLDRDQRAPDGSRIGWGTTMTEQDICFQTYDNLELNHGLERYGGDTAIAYDMPQEEYDSDQGTYDGSQPSDPSYDGITRTTYDPVLNTGCPQCGTLRYNK